MRSEIQRSADSTRWAIKEDPIVVEVRRIRDEHARRFGYDLHAIVRDLKRYEQQADRPVVRREPKRISEEAA